MKIEIFELRPGKGGYVINERKPVAVITVENGRGSFSFKDKSRERLLRQLFDGPVITFAGEGGIITSDGFNIDSTVTYPAWSEEAVRAVVEGELMSFNLGGRILFDGT